MDRMPRASAAVAAIAAAPRINPDPTAVRSLERVPKEGNESPRTTLLPGRPATLGTGVNPAVSESWVSTWIGARSLPCISSRSLATQAAEIRISRAIRLSQINNPTTIANEA